MDDKELIELYFKRDENAIAHTMKKYGARLKAMAGRLISDENDIEECLNDTYYKLWNAIPPHRPHDSRDVPCCQNLLCHR